ncbi:MAG: hypothetical protein WAN48_05870, partial [Actinomycetes bacterium]
ACPGGSPMYSGLSVSGTPHTFRVKATDLAGNTATSNTYSWTVAATVSVVLGWDPGTPPPASVTNKTTGNFAFTTSVATTNVCKLDGVVQAACTGSDSVSTLTDGPHTYSVAATGGAPSQTVTITYSWTVDTVAPPAPVINAPSGTVVGTSANVSVVAAEAGNSLTCLVTPGTVTPSGDDCSTPLSLTGLVDGDFTVDAKATDAAGNATSASRTWTVDNTGPVATLTAPSTLTAPLTLLFDEPAYGLSASSVLLRLGGGAALAGSLTCKDASAVMVDCSVGPVTSASVTPAKPLMPGQHYEGVVNPLGVTTVADTLGNVSAPTTFAFRGARIQQENSPAAKATWQVVKAKKAKGGSYLMELRKGASASWTFTGKSVQWVTVKGPTFGVADVFVDGVRKATVNNYAKSTSYGVRRSITGLSAGTHTLKIVVKGKKGSRRAKDVRVAVDGFLVGKKLSATPAVTTTWQRVSSKKAYSNGYSIATLKGQSVSFQFRGTAVRWVTGVGPACGKVSVLVDGVKVGTVDSYAKVAKFKVPHDIKGLSDAVHTLKLVVTGTKNKKSSGTGVVIDGWVVS